MHNKLRNIAFLVSVAVLSLHFIPNGVTTIVAQTQSTSTCAALNNTDGGLVEYTLTLPQDGVYTLWSRVNAPSPAANAFLVAIDATCPIVVGNASTQAFTSWEWINYKDGDATKQASFFLSSGSHTLRVKGIEPGIKLDTLFLTKDSSCQPSGLTVNCQNQITPTSVPTATPTIAPSIKPTATPLPTRIPTPTSISASCVNTTSTWQNQPIPEQIGQFTMTYEATPTAPKTDAVTGLSGQTATGYSQLAAIARFNEAGYIDARNGDSYTARNLIRYIPGTMYNFRMVVNPTSGTYSVYVKAPNTAEQLVGDNLSFRTEQKGLTVFRNLALISEENSNNVCNVKLNNAPIVLDPTKPKPQTLRLGLQTIYFDRDDLSGKFVARIEPWINARWRGWNPVPGIDDNTFSVRWTGYIVPQHSETYTFYAAVDDGVRLWVDNKMIINQWDAKGEKEHTGTITLSANKNYAIRMEYRQNNGDSRARLYWSSNSRDKQTVPKERFNY